MQPIGSANRPPQQDPAHHSGPGAAVVRVVRDALRNGVAPPTPRGRCASDHPFPAPAPAVSWAVAAPSKKCSVPAVQTRSSAAWPQTGDTAWRAMTTSRGLERTTSSTAASTARRSATASPNTSCRLADWPADRRPSGRPVLHAGLDPQILLNQVDQPFSLIVDRLPLVLGEVRPLLFVIAHEVC